MRKSISNSGCNMKSAGRGWAKAQDLSQYTAVNYSLLARLEGGTLLMHIAVIKHSYTDSLAY